jgi:hypothetical protein
LDAQLREQAIRSLEKNVEENLRRGDWPVYSVYEIVSDREGTDFVRAPELNRVRKVLRPLSRESADLFLRFAGWVEEFGMDKELGSSRNVEAARSWVDEYGVLGLNPPDMSVLGLVNSQRVTADYLGMPWWGDVVAGRRNTAHGGGPNESVENFAFEAWEAHIVLRLYTSLRSQEVVDTDSVVPFMSPEPVEPWSSYVEREIYSQDPELTRRWALAIVESAVNRKIEDHCYPKIQGASGLYAQGWGVRSLLGAMWLQMMFLMRADRRCWWCGKPIDPGRRKHARFCDNNGVCRSNWHYHEGEGKSSKEKRRQARYIR